MRGDPHLAGARAGVPVAAVVVEKGGEPYERTRFGPATPLRDPSTTMTTITAHAQAPAHESCCSRSGSGLAHGPHTCGVPPPPQVSGGVQVPQSMVPPQQS